VKNKTIVNENIVFKRRCRDFVRSLDYFGL